MLDLSPILLRSVQLNVLTLIRIKISEITCKAKKIFLEIFR